MAGSGAAWISNGEYSSAVWSLTFSTMLQCSGYTIIDSETTSITAQVIECCNFYSNSLLSNISGVIWVRNYAPSLLSCIFSGNTPPDKELLLYSPSTTRGFSLTNCVFSGNLPNSSMLLSVVNVLTNTKTASFELNHYYTRYCPSPSPVATKAPIPSLTFSASDDFASSITGFPAELLKDTSSLSETGNFAIQSNHLKETSGITETNCFQLSSEVLQSSPLTVTPPPGTLSPTVVFTEAFFGRRAQILFFPVRMHLFVFAWQTLFV
jgi:hypothetical protein